MQAWQIVAIGVAIAILAVVGWWIYERNRSRRLRDLFGSEYDRRIAERGNRRQAESELARSEARLRNLRIQSLSPADHTKFLDQWGLCQALFVDDPAGAVEEADRIVTDLMRARGYTVDDPYERVSDICAAYPRHASAYREANDILIRHRRGQSSTEGLRKAFVNYRSLFDEILGGQDEEFKRVA